MKINLFLYMLISCFFITTIIIFFSNSDFLDKTEWKQIYINNKEMCLSNVIIKENWWIETFFHRPKNLYNWIDNISKNIENYLELLREENAYEIWKNYINKNNCNKIKEENLSNSFINFYSKDELFKYIWCNIYLDKEKQAESIIETSYEKYREINIWWWLSTLENKVWSYWEEISIYKEIRNFNWYINWPYVVWNEIREIWWWWVCWVSTVAYQAFSLINWIEITERHNHNIIDINTFWTIWFDSSIFWDWTTPTKDLKAKNNHWKIFIIWISEWNKELDYYNYWIRLYTWNKFKKNEIIFSEIYKLWNRYCIDKILKKYSWEKEKITSCYFEIKE